MREIKFRGKSLNTKRWVYGDLQHKGKRTFIEYEVNPDTVGQFTGLKDDNGTEIYESDIVEMDFSGNYDKEVRKVVYDEYEAAFLLEDKDLYAILVTTSVHNTLCHMYVIGNIYDNPELLKGKSNEGK